MNEFMIWFWKPIAEALGAMFMLFAFGLVVLAIYFAFYYYTMFRLWLKKKFKKNGWSISGVQILHVD